LPREANVAAEDHQCLDPDTPPTMTKRWRYSTPRGDCPNLEPKGAVQPYVVNFLHPSEPHIVCLDRIMKLWK
ncbi:MAG: hypothetical protein WEC36_07955, partial [Phycisphaeraceae bacterium]